MLSSPVMDDINSLLQRKETLSLAEGRVTNLQKRVPK